MAGDEHEFEIEPVEGLPELPPDGETILWQGRPNWWALAKEALWVRGVAIYFVLLMVWQVGTMAADHPMAVSLAAAIPFAILGVVAISILLVIAWGQSVTTVYTVTNRRVAMRIGVALNVTYNLPYRWIEGADLELRKSGTGTIALSLKGKTRLGYLSLWPHARPWQFREPKPALRCIPDAQAVADLLANAAATQVLAVKTSPEPPTETQAGAAGAAPMPAE